MKITIGAIAGGIILFIWQFISYGMADLHYSQMAYTPHQEEILNLLSEVELEEGEYFLPRLPKDRTADQHEFMMEQQGRPWVMLQYHHELETTFFSNLVRALITNSLAVGILCWLLLQFRELSMTSSIIAAVGIGVMAYCTTTYLNSIWYKTNTWPDLLDAVVPWVLTGAWLGWWLRR